MSDDVNVTIRLSDGTKIVRTTHTRDGKWVSISNGFVEETVTHWMPLPEPPADCGRRLTEGSESNEM